MFFPASFFSFILSFTPGFIRGVVKERLPLSLSAVSLGKREGGEAEGEVVGSPAILIMDAEAACLLTSL